MCRLKGRTLDTREQADECCVKMLLVAGDLKSTPRRRLELA